MRMLCGREDMSDPERKFLVNEQIRYKPRKGKNYDSGGMFGLKLMILGESHYEWKPGALTSNISDELINENIKGARSHRFYTNVFQAVTGQSKRSAGLPAVKEFWESVLFYNYVQVPVGEKPRKSPSTAMWKDSKPAVVQTVQKYEPDAILALGIRLWRRLKHLEIVDRLAGETGRFAGQSTDCWIRHINHPSSVGFKWSKWNEKIARFLEGVRLAKQEAIS